MVSVQFFTRHDCGLCRSALAVLKRVQSRVPFDLEIRDIESDPQLTQRFGDVIPVITSGSQELARSFVDEKTLVAALQKLIQKA